MARPFARQLLFRATLCRVWSCVLAVWRCKQPPVGSYSGLLPLRIATCITGLIVSGRKDAVNSGDPNSYPSSGYDIRRGPAFVDPAMHGALQDWSKNLSKLNISNDFFLRLDLRSELMTRRQGANRWYLNFSDPAALASRNYSSYLDVPECNPQGKQRSRTILQPALDALRPVSVHLEPLPCYCGFHDCSCTAMLPNWWEQMSKVHACYTDVVKHEKHILHQTYDYILRLRSDFDLRRNGLSAEAFAATIRKSIYGVPRISTFPFGPCYMNIDWAWMAPRRLASVAFSITQATCDWHECIRNHPKKMPKSFWGIKCIPADSDSLLTEWWLSQTASFDAMSLQPPRSARGLLNNLVCANDAQQLGLINLSRASFHRAAACLHMHTKQHVKMDALVEP